MDVRELIIKRRSIRKYDMTPLDNGLLNEIEVFMKQTAPLSADTGKFGYKVVGHDEFFKTTGGMFRIKAPHYLIFFGDGSDESYKNIGFVGELTVLKLTEMNIGTCWLGGAKSKELLDNDGYAVSIAFGRPLEAFRNSGDDIDRKELKEIAEGFRLHHDVLEFVRLAPSAVNYQPWFFRCEKDQIHIYRKKTGGVMISLAKSIKTLQKIDIGIAIAHFSTRPFVYKKLRKSDDGGMTYEGTVFLN